MSELQDKLVPRLDGITTRWSLIQRANRGSPTTASEAQKTLVLRYSSSIRQYVRALTNNEDQADEIAQDAVVRLLRGDFAGADPSRGRFRDLLKVSVKNMVRNFWDREKRRTSANINVDQLSNRQVSTESDQADPWLDAWRKNVLDLAWSAAREYEQQNPDSLTHTILRLRTEFSDESSDELASRLSKQLNKSIRADAFRQKLRRARIRFAEFLIEEVADGLDDASMERVQDELIAIGLFEHVRNVMPTQHES